MAYLAGAFAIAWLLTFGYLLSLIQRQRRLERDIAIVREMLEAQEREGH
ncbi:MAG TPA: CcmD family protein [Caldilineae bacterium]|nr:CcmD family protein [Caldilineae bacterium]